MKTGRQRKILELINKYEIETQEDLVSRLEAEGFEVTQATISRDIRELGITKLSLNGKVQRYVTVRGTDGGMNNRLLGVLRTGYVSLEQAGNILVVKTVPGMAMAVAAALDALRWDEIVGCIAGDDTIFCALRNEELFETVQDKLADLLSK